MKPFARLYRPPSVPRSTNPQRISFSASAATGGQCAGLLRRTGAGTANMAPPRSMTDTSPSARLAGIARHLLAASSSPHPIPAASSHPSTPSRHQLHTASAATPPSTMSSQPEHSTLLIPGPIEFDDAVLQSMSHYSESHVGPAFVSTFGDVLANLRKLFQNTDPTAQPFVLSGSGTLGWDLAAANLVEPGEAVLVLGTGYFSDGFADCLRIYGADVTELKAPVGSRPQLAEIEAALKARSYKAITVTHVDTSTGVLSELRDLSALVHRVSPDTLVLVDGVCSVACEEIAFDEWKLDGVVTASQKAIGVPAGLSISLFSGRAIKALESRKEPPRAYFASMKNWLPIMRNYEAKKASYFATPSPQLVHALDTALKQILSVPLAERFAKHKAASDKIKAHIAELGLKQVAENPDYQAHGMTAIYLPETVTQAQILPSLAKQKVVFAGGIHKEIASKYIRFGHMGVSVLQPERGDIDRALKALDTGLAEFGYQKA
ncbi:aminotransferase class 5 [Grosmannia clavigera kw1407]|uniref:alanine--glyoxylate transaminase n=1 Tax=Grosmannia clavigera (strain kw1407 / UAMH 11150) TaxID=655863 RepID=F0XTJ6_GROCL|nr:aminotransferase class 5 [Grosmannia clavigera kw1407]EFW99054.1 aminotransferase class 5 [Grosmannia clavigera kw1407]